MAAALQARTEAEIADADAVDRIARVYLGNAAGDPYRALSDVIIDALVDLSEAERRCDERERLVSRGYVRAVLYPPA